MSQLTIDDILGPRFAGRRFLRPNDLFELGIVDNRATMDYWVEQGVLPPPMRVGKRCLLFPVSEVAALFIARARERDEEHSPLQTHHTVSAQGFVLARS
jgi:predicted DNA-binding transcriptional regulator AlpA